MSSSHVPARTAAGTVVMLMALAAAGPTPATAQRATATPLPATLPRGSAELSTDFEVRGDPAVEATRADYAAREEAALRARDVETRINRMINAIQPV